MVVGAGRLFVTAAEAYGLVKREVVGKKLLPRLLDLSERATPESVIFGGGR